MPVAVRSSASRLVSIVTATTFVLSGAAALASSSIARPPLAWTVRIAGSSGPSAWIALATVLGMSCSFRSRKIGRPSFAISCTPCCPWAQKNSRPSLMPPTWVRVRVAIALARARSGVSIAT
ncbi:hypothetical protein BJP26_07480 [Sphingomonas melonis TY]|nr:hypothetical protein BJP26_07480 [Sphingomonas melonis TY]